MSHEEDPGRRKVSLEDLMRVKRAERPDREFWASWQSEMRVRTRSAAHQPRPWWRDALPRTWIAIARWQAPIGVTALGALCVVAYLEYRPSLVNPPASLPVPETRGDFASVPVQSSAMSELREAPRTVSLADPINEPGAVSRAVAMLSDPIETRSPAARRIAANFALVAASEPFRPHLRSLQDSVRPESIYEIPAQLKGERLMNADYAPVSRGRVLGLLREEEIYENTVRRLGSKKLAGTR